MDVHRKIIHKSQADGPSKELSSHILSLWDRYITSTLDQYAAFKINVNIAKVLFFPTVWGFRWFSFISGATQFPLIFLWRNPGYNRFLMQFFEDKERSGIYHMDGTVYAHAALECFQNMFNPNDK